MEKTIKRLTEQLSHYFDRARIKDLGRESLFVQRSSAKLGSYEFLLMNIFDRSSGKEKSLNDSCDWLEEHFGISLTKQSLDERYNTYSVLFMKRCFEQLLAKLQEQELRKLELKNFSSIQLTDATSFRIPDQLSTFYKGYKGRGGAAILKAHFNYDLLNGKIEEISLGDGSLHDNAYNFGDQEEIKEKGLYLRDLGYYSFAYFQQLEDAGAYFLSKAKTNAIFYQKDESGNYQRLSLAEYLPLVATSAITDLAQVYLGTQKNIKKNIKKKTKKKTKKSQQEKLAVRLVVQAVPEQVAQKRLKKLAEYHQKQKDKTVSEQRKAMCYYNVFITNIPQQELAAEKIRLVYSLRWQIEIMFKLWKSHYNIDKTHKMSIFRFECHIYAQLIAILLDYSLQQGMEPVFLEDLQKEMSPIKASKLIKKTS